MSNLDDYKSAKTEHETICKIIATCNPGIGDISQYNSQHYIGFLFRERGLDLTYRTRLATMLGKACKAKLHELVELAKQLSEADLAEKAQAAQAEAVETLQTVRVEKGEPCPATAQ